MCVKSELLNCSGGFSVVVQLSSGGGRVQEVSDWPWGCIATSSHAWPPSGEGGALSWCEGQVAAKCKVVSTEELLKTREDSHEDVLSV